MKMIEIGLKLRNNFIRWYIQKSCIEKLQIILTLKFSCEFHDIFQNSFIEHLRTKRQKFMYFLYTVFKTNKKRL